MRVAVIGAGGMGGGIARLLAGSHEVAVGSRDAAKGEQQAGSWGSLGVVARPTRCATPRWCSSRSRGRPSTRRSASSAT
jgi:predicted dinucleotide-binding enzyme